MRIKPFEKMRLDPEIKNAMMKNNGGRPPDNFVESAEGTILGRPNIDTDPQGQQMVAGLDEMIGRDYPKVQEELEKY